MNTSSLACRERARKASEEKDGQIFEPKMFGNAIPLTPIKRGSNSPAYEMRKHKQKKREGKREREKRGRNAGSNRKKQKKNLHVHTFPHRDPCAMTFRECKKLAVLDCKE